MNTISNTTEAERTPEYFKQHYLEELNYLLIIWNTLKILKLIERMRIFCNELRIATLLYTPEDSKVDESDLTHIDNFRC